MAHGTWHMKFRALCSVSLLSLLSLLFLLFCFVLAATWNAIRCPVPLLSSSSLLLSLSPYSLLLLLQLSSAPLQVMSAVGRAPCPAPFPAPSVHENCYLAQCRRFPGHGQRPLPPLPTAFANDNEAFTAFPFFPSFPAHPPFRCNNFCLGSTRGFFFALIRRIALIVQITCYLSIFICLSGWATHRIWTTGTEPSSTIAFNTRYGKVKSGGSVIERLLNTSAPPGSII